MPKAVNWCQHEGRHFGTTGLGMARLLVDRHEHSIYRYLARVYVKSTPAESKGERPAHKKPKRKAKQAPTELR